MLIASMMSQQPDKMVLMSTPQVQSTMANLEVLLEWSHMFVNILERWVSRKYFGF